MEFKNAYKYIDNYDTMKYLGEPTLPIFDDQKYMDILSKYWLIIRIHKIGIIILSVIQP